MTVSEKDYDRFSSKLIINPDDIPEGLRSPCWHWDGAKSRGKGNLKYYGTFSYKGKSMRAHAFVCDHLKETPCPPGHHRDHLCNNSLCVNPEHLEIVTKEENDKRKWERIRSGT